MNSVEYFQRKRFSKICIKFARFKLSLAIDLPIMEVPPPFEQTSITLTQGHFVCNI